MRPVLLAYVIVSGLAILLSLWIGAESRRFIRQTSSIADAATLERFKALARRNMRFALLQIALLLTGIVIGIFLVRLEGLLALVPVLLTNGGLVALGLYHAHFERAARCLPAATPELHEQHQSISKAWVSRPLPDF